MRLLGIDYGTKKVGVAFTNEEGTMAFPHQTIPNNVSLLDILHSFAVEKGVQGVVVGRSHNLEGEPNAVQSEIDTFVEELKAKLSLPVYEEGEQFSTQAALRIQGRTNETDASAAALILDSYITKHASKE